MQTKEWALIMALFLLGGCASSPKPEIMVFDKSINLEVIEATQISQQENNTKVSDKTTSEPNNQTPVKQKKAVKLPQLATAEVANLWAFPVAGKVIKTFSKQHPGITFDTQLGQAVRAISDGVVIYSDDIITKHGNMIIIKHPLGFYSAYTQNRNLNVKQGEAVKKGAIIALTGKTDFYFAMKKFKTPIDPLKYLK